VSRSFQLTRRVAAAVAVGATALLAAACSAGQTAQTSTEQSTVDGTSATAGKIALRDLRIAYPYNGRYTAGSSAVLQFAAVNTGGQADKLVSVSVESSVASTVVLRPPTATSQSASPSGSPSASASASSSAPTDGQQSVDLPAGTLVDFDNDAALAQLLDLRAALISGQTVPITFTFARGGSVTVAVPVATSLTEVQHPAPVTQSGTESQ
jgi:copper(I)-binding protein